MRSFIAVRRKMAAVLFLSALLLLEGCSSQPSSVTQAKNNNAQAQAIHTTAARRTDITENQYIVVEPKAKKGADGKLHDAFINGDLKITEGQPVTLNFYNYDEMEHTMTSPDLGLNIKLKASTEEGKPGVTTYTFTPKKAGEYSWFCADPCDLDQKQWAMSQEGFMKGKITVLPSTNTVQYVSLVVNADYKAGPDGKLHDAYTPGNIVLNAGQPVELTVYNFDDVEHSFACSQLGFELIAKGSREKGVPEKSTLKFTPEQLGTFSWQCHVACDGKYREWAMYNKGYMTGDIVVQ